MGDADNAKSEGAELDRVFRLLADQRRRFVLHELQKRGGFTSISTLAERLSDQESAGDDDSVLISLLHRHVPHMVEAGAITFDSDAQEVALTEKGEHIDEFRQAYSDMLSPLCC